MTFRSCFVYFSKKLSIYFLIQKPFIIIFLEITLENTSIDLKNCFFFFTSALFEGFFKKNKTARVFNFMSYQKKISSRC